MEHVIIAADPDEPGEQAAQSAVRRWRFEGRRVEIVHPTSHGDFNDALMTAQTHSAGLPPAETDPGLGSVASPPSN